MCTGRTRPQVEVSVHDVLAGLDPKQRWVYMCTGRTRPQVEVGIHVYWQDLTPSRGGYACVPAGLDPK